ncbi:MAG TPA: HAMP domain-containing sensor histidine kinase [Solirubrobacteraceae bacterium]|nr:HAMP domain-containing sensor histidine kinase [Solirubrobacteraceae bacterium]
MFLVLGTVIVVLIFAIGAGQSSVAASSASAAPVGQAGASVAHAAASQQHTADVNRLLGGAWVTLVLTALVSAPLGWFVAGRVLRPLRQMSLATQEISAGSLHQRLALTGPADEFKQLGDTIDDLLRRLESSFAAQRRFVANAAHELRTPLTVERALLQVALADPDADAAKLRATCEEVIASSREQELLLDALLTLATSERGLYRRDVVDLASVAKTAVAGASSAAADLEVVTVLEPVLLTGDRALVERLMHNLIENAVDYNRPGGRIEVRTESAPGRATLTVVNTGPEIPAEQVDALFEPFRRRGSDRTSTGPHHGLGLSIVRAVAQVHQAELSAESPPGGGLHVTVSFPN